MTSFNDRTFPTVNGLSLRALHSGDEAALLELALRIAKAEKTHWLPQASDLVEIFSSSKNPVAENSLVGFDADGVPRAYGHVSKSPAGAKAYAFGGVDPLWQRRGIGGAVLAWQEQLIVRRFAADGTLPPVARSYSDEGNVAHEALLTGAGYAVVRYFSEMIRPLAELPAVPSPVGIRIVDLTPDLTDAVRLAHNEAFADHWGSEPRDPQDWGFLMDHEDLRADWCSVALDEATGEVAGYQISLHDPNRFAMSGRLEGYTELLGVRRAWRGRGIAPALLADAMARYAAAGMDHAALDVDTENPSGAHGLYASLGYTPSHRTMAWDKSLTR